MSKHAIDRAGWPPAERDEYETVLAEVVDTTSVAAERIDALEVRLADAIQAHRPWANEVERACRRFGLGKEITRFEDRSRAMVSYDGQVMNLPAKQSRRVVAANGGVAHQRELIELWSWDEIAAKRAESLHARRTYDAKVAHLDRLLALREMAPAASTPDEAARLAGIDIETWLAVAA